jgi:hypothetical protein
MNLQRHLTQSDYERIHSLISTINALNKNIRQLENEKMIAGLELRELQSKCEHLMEPVCSELVHLNCYFKCKYCQLYTLK